MNMKRMIIILSSALLLFGGTILLLLSNSRSEDKPTISLPGAGADNVTEITAESREHNEAQAESPIEGNISSGALGEQEESIVDMTAISIPVEPDVQSKVTDTAISDEAQENTTKSSQEETNVFRRISKTDPSSDQKKVSDTQKKTSTNPTPETPTAQSTDQIPDAPAGTSTDSAAEPDKNTSTDSSIPSSMPKTEPTPKSTESENKPDVSSDTVPEPTTECSHTWVWATRTRTIHHDAVIKEGYWHVISEAYDKPVSVRKLKCGHCKKLYDDYDDYAMNDDCDGSYGWVTVDSGQAIHVDEEKEWIEPEVIQEAYDETVTENDYQYCSKCNKRK